MADYLLDTHTLIWMQEGNSELSKKIIDIVTDSEQKLFLSVVSLWEISIKLSKERLKLNYTLDEIVDYCIENQIQIIPIKLHHLNLIKLLPFYHKDPFDRMIIAVAYTDNLFLLSKDSKLSLYNVQTIW
ncbi:type II toxin-antitoxin system VapC family toxin [Parafilimonas terrae]|jgi:PIN domain nuclease of toxin-antitoxin system|uniref:PIN domain nuclease, a component of toxin-antitoxin system (PIN domain) n=1 Tax=Parafilimonas terrae TaxID=1465490 RepID=A0A1I5XMZ7_9BACT|nr:type II toxin-antitoxin system VapC family toxin [Parafilimonas terrae]SFQ33186.1 PIN domain nuclease, a component of toxin-antitoxin system (PIN domain) [Parafilimonas terrae]